MAWGDLRLPGQSQQWREHPSDVGSPSYFADKNRGWTQNQSNLNTAAINARRNTRDPGITGRPSWRDFDYTPSQGYDRSGAATGNLGDYGRNYRNIELANRRGIASLDEDEKMGLLGHTKKALSGFNLGDFPVPKTMKMVGDTISDAMRGSRLMGTYQDMAVAEGRSKAAGYKDWESDKRSMMTEDAKVYEQKYLDLADMTDDPERKQYYLNEAETAWRNKQTSDQLAAVTGFEGYAPSHYTGEGEGSRFTGGHSLSGQRVPGYGRIREIMDKYWGGSPQDYEQGEHWDIAPDRDLRANQNFVDVKDAMEGMSGFDIAPKADEIFPGDITDDIGFRSGIGQEGGYQEISRPPGGYLDASRNIPEYEKPSWWKNAAALGFGIPGYYEQDYTDKYGLDNPDLDFLDYEEYYKNR